MGDNHDMMNATAKEPTTTAQTELGAYKNK